MKKGDSFFDQEITQHRKFGSFNNSLAPNYEIKLGSMPSLNVAAPRTRQSLFENPCISAENPFDSPCLLQSPSMQTRRQSSFISRITTLSPRKLEIKPPNPVKVDFSMLNVKITKPVIRKEKRESRGKKANNLKT